MRLLIVFPALLAFSQMLFAQEWARSFKTKLDRATVDVWPGGGVFPQLVDSSGWKTSIFITNMDTAPVNMAIFFLNDRGDPMSLPVGGRQVAAIATSLQPDRSYLIETDGVGDLKQGYAVLMGCDRPCSDASSLPVNTVKLGAISVFRQRVPGRPDNEAVVPLEQPESHVHIAFDSRAGLVTGIAVLNLAAESVALTIRDQNGLVLVTDYLTVPKFEKTVFALETKYPAVVGKFGIVEIRGFGILAMGLRFNQDGAFTSSHSMSVH